MTAVDTPTTTQEAPQMSTTTTAPPEAPRLPPPVQLFGLFHGMRIGQAVYALAALGVADFVVDGPYTVAELADKVGADAQALQRVLRAAAAAGVFALEPDGTVAMTPMARLLVRDADDSLRDLALLHGDLFWEPFGAIVDSVRSGRPAAEAVFGTSFFRHLEQHPERAAVFDRAMTQLSGALNGWLLHSLDVSRFQRIADVGGGRGHFLAELLARNPAAEGVLLDRAPVIAGARELLAERGLAERVAAVPHDFFEALPVSDCDAYVLKAVLLNWSDDDAVRILRRVRDAIGERRDARLLVIEQVLAAPNTPDPSAYVDLDMLLVLGGRQRTAQEWRDLVEAGGFTVVTDPVPGQWNTIECAPR